MPLSEDESETRAMRLAEAVIFASREPVTARMLANLLPETADLDAVLAALAARYEGAGVQLACVAGGWQFRTAADLAPALRKVVELPRRLPRVAMETLAIIAYHQPVTRSEIEDIRGAALAQTTLDLLLELALVTTRGRRETPGRPMLWGTTPAFLAQFGLQDLRDLPKREELLIEPAPIEPAPPGAPAGESAAADEAGADQAGTEAGAEEAGAEKAGAEEAGAEEAGAEKV